MDSFSKTGICSQAPGELYQSVLLPSPPPQSLNWKNAQNKQTGRDCSDHSTPDGRHEAGTLEDCQVLLSCNQPCKRGCSRSPQGQYGTFAGLTALCQQPDALCDLLAFKSPLKVIQNTLCWQFSGGESPILSMMSNVPYLRYDVIGLWDSYISGSKKPLPNLLPQQPDLYPVKGHSSHKPGRSSCRNDPSHQVLVEMHGAVHLLFDLQLQHVQTSANIL